MMFNGSTTAFSSVKTLALGDGGVGRKEKEVVAKWKQELYK